MKRLSLISVVFLILFLAVGLAAYTSALADQYIVVVPPNYDFDEVELGTSRTLNITIMNTDGHHLYVEGISFQEGSSSDFFLDPVPELPWTIAPGNSRFLSVVFMPSSEGEHAASLDIVSDDPETPLVTIPLQGIGIAQLSVTIEDILAFFDAGVEAGTIQGTGPSNNAKENHLKVFKLKLLMVAVFLESGANREACTLLWHAYDRSDSQQRPPDFIEDGPASNDVFELNQMILELLDDLGCL